MDPEEQELLGDYRYRNYSSAIEKALRNFESSSEWADLISSLGKLNKALQSNLKYSLLPRRLIISKRLSQCLHPALPSGVHLKALETYEIIFKIIGTKWLAKDLFLYSSGLFPLLANAAMSVRPVLLGLYEKYFLPLQKSLLPGLQAFVIGLLPGLEEGSEIYDRTDALLVKLSLLMGKEVFYGALWGSVLVSPSIRLPASLFVVSHINRELSGKQQKYMLGTDYKLTIKSLCVSVLDSNVLVQRNTLEVILFFFPFDTALDYNENAILLRRTDIVYVLSAATQTLLRRDMSLNRRLYAWLLGSDIKGGTFAPESTTSEDHAIYFFGKYSRDLLVESLAEILHQKFSESDTEDQHQAYLKPFRILISLLDKPEIGPQVVGDLFLEVIRAFYSYCKDALGSDLKLSYNQSGNVLASAIKENKNASEIVKTVNVLITSLSTDFLWDYMTKCFEDCFRYLCYLKIEHPSSPKMVHNSFLCKIIKILDCNSDNKKEKEEDWDLEQVMLVLGPLKADCKEAFAAACHLLLDCTTFPVYLSEEEMEQLYISLFQFPGCDASFPLWLKSLMTICCCVNDCYVQNVSIFTLLEVINHSQSLALVIEDRMKRYKVSGHNPFLGKLQMVTLPPIAPGVLKIISEKTDFYQRVACVLWNQLNKETREHHIACVELFYRLHCLAPSANICEDIICHALLDHDKGTRLEALFRFSVMWHLTREIQGSRVSSHNRSFDRSLFVVLDSLNCSDGAIGAAAQGWLIRALSLNDVARILEPVLLLLLHPKTQRTSIHYIKQKNSTEDIHNWLSKKKVSWKESCVSESNSEENLPLSQFTAVDREAIWAEVEKDPEKLELKTEQSENDASCNPVTSHEADGDQDNSEHTESADTSTGHDSENTSSFSPSLELQEMSNEDSAADGKENTNQVFLPESSKSSVALNLVRADSERTQASESLSSDEEVDLELQEITNSRLLKQQKEKQEMAEALFKHMLLYLQPYDSKRVLYAFSVLEAVLKTNPKEFVEAVASTSMDTSSTAHLNLIYNLLARHQEALVGQSFYGKLQTQSPTMCPHSLLIELLTYLCLSFLRSYYPCYLKVTHRDVLGNRDVQVKSVEVLIRMMTQLATMAKAAENKNVEFIRNLLGRCKIQEFVLLSLSASMYTSQKRYELLMVGGVNNVPEEDLFEESLINFGHDQIWSEHPLQIELLKLLQVLIVLEHHLGQTPEEQENQPDLSREWQQALNFQQAIGAMQYVYPHPITSQGLFVSAVVRGLQPEYGYGMHPTWVSLVTCSLPYFGKSLGWTVAPFVVQICKNLDELVKQYENEAVKISVKTSARENVTPDYPLTLLEGLTTIGHFCLLDHPNQTKKSSCLAEPANLRNARNAILEELPRIINTMSLLWNVIKREDSQKRPTDFFGTTKGSSSVYFKATKTLRTKILDFLNPLTAQLGIQLMTAVAAVWNSKKPHRNQSKIKILPVASASQLILVDLICALNTMKTDTILHLVKEVVKKPSQIKGEEKSSLVDIPMLQFSYAFIQRLPVAALQENFQSLLGLLKESVQLNLAPPGHFLLLSTLNDFVTRTPTLENKKDQKDLQEVTQKILEAVGNVAGSSLEQTSWLSRNLEVKAQPQILPDEFNTEDVNDTSVAPSSMVSASAPSIYSVQALSLLAEVLASLLDMVYRSDEKEKAVPLISRLLYYVFPYLRNHSTYNIPSFRAGSQLLSSLSGYAYTKRAWKKEVLELYMDPAFFQMDTSCTQSIIDHLLTHEKTMFKDLMNMQSSALKLYPSFEQKAMLLKRQAFAVFSGEIDQYHLYLPLIQERLTENLRVGQTSLVAAQMFLLFRVLLLRISPQHLTSLWPIMVTELIQTFLQLEEELTEEDEPSNNSKLSKQKVSGDGSGTDIQQNELSLYLSACKFLDTALSFPPDKMQLFQMYKWAFVPEVDTESSTVTSHLVENHQECRPHIIRIMDLLKMKYGERNNTAEGISKRHKFPLLNFRTISSITQLMPFFKTLCCAFTTKGSEAQNSHTSASLSVDYVGSNGIKILQQLEESVECDFLENMES
uniref:DOP1 leucine zipper like protein B n=1 Tax=Chrysolophus pictus TaxID=9089 RepID=A0A8C3KY73_CHRPC